jgi:hypothetical protein
MRAKILLVCILLVPAASAGGQEAATNDRKAPDAAYRAVMKAQYEADEPPPPMRADEAQSIYDAYLRTIGRPDHRRQSPDSGLQEDRPQRWPGP